jgi:hypothetical protein
MNYDKNQLLHESALDFRRQVAVCVQRERHDLRRFVKTWSTNANSPCLTVEFDNSVMVRIATCTWFLFCVHALLSKLGGKPKLHCESGFTNFSNCFAAMKIQKADLPPADKRQWIDSLRSRLCRYGKRQPQD